MRRTALCLTLAVATACGARLDLAVEVFRACMSEGGHPVSSVTVGERPSDGALSFGFSLVEPDNAAMAIAEECTGRAAAAVGRAADP